MLRVVILMPCFVSVTEVKISIPVDATVFELKRAIYIASDVIPERQLLLYKDKELRKNEARLSEYGIVSACSLTMNVKMHTGIIIEHAADNMVCLPLLMPVSNTKQLRNTIRTMTNVQDRHPRKKTENSTAVWTPEKQMEHEMTRNRMKKLLQKRKRKTILSSPPHSQISSPGSVISRSPPEPLSPAELSGKTAVSSGSNVKMDKCKDKQVTEKDLKVFFEPPETIDELLRSRHELFLAPENEDDLNQLKNRRNNLDKTRCKLCHHRLPLSEQEIRCLCGFVFCKYHREPSTHRCHIDYKVTGRRKIVKENPKVDCQGAHKARVE